ncbi:uncharacterized protein LOC120336437 isoform X1 [Styela clava]
MLTQRFLESINQSTWLQLKFLIYLQCWIYPILMSLSNNPNLYQWKKFKKQTLPKPSKTKKDDIQCWLEKVEAATDVAIKKTFSEYKPSAVSQTRYSTHHGDDLSQVMDKLHDYEDSHAEAQELVSDWMNEKIRFDYLDNDEENLLTNSNVEFGQQPVRGIETATSEKWYQDSEAFIQSYLEKDNPKSSFSRSKHERPVQKNDVLGQLDIYEADENTVVKALLKNMMEKPLIKPNEMKVLKKKSILSEKKHTKFHDPTTTMDMRHKEVKEARLRKQKQEEKKRQERMIQKEAKFKAQQILKEEEMQKKLRKKKEEEAIQIEMAKLRKEMIEQKKREENQRREKEKKIEKGLALENESKMTRRQEIERIEREKQKEIILSEISRIEDKERRVAERMKKRNTENRILLHKCFSTWCKIVLNQRVKLGKAKAMSDWKCMQNVWNAWKSYTRNRRLEIETKHHQTNMRETRLKEKKAVNCEKYRLMRKSFFTWKVWVKTEQERKEILKQQNTTKAKMQALLDAFTSGNIGNKIEEPMIIQSVESISEVESELPHFQPKKPPIISNPGHGANNLNHTTKPKHAWQVTKKDVHRLKPAEMRHLSDKRHNTPQATTQEPRVKVHVQSIDPYIHRHKFQKEVIDQQRVILHEQKRMIEEMQEQQKILALQKEVAVLQQQHKQLENNKISSLGDEQSITRVQPQEGNSTEVPQPLSARSYSSGNSVAKKHPIVSKMEERAAERLKRRKELEEIKRKREEEKIKKMQEEEEQKEREEQEKKMRQIEERREAKRMQKKLEEEKKAAQERMRQLCKMADNHYTKTLIKNYGFVPWKKLIQSTKSKWEVAVFHHRSILMRKVLFEWKIESERAREEREQKADKLYRLILLRRGMRSWMKYGERMEILEQKAIIHRNKVLRKKYLKYWVDYTTDEKLSEWDKEARADAHNRTRLLRRVFNVIRSYRELIVKESERRKRLGEMRRKVSQLLPDFQYSQDSFTSDMAGDEIDENFDN